MADKKTEERRSAVIETVLTGIVAIMVLVTVLSLVSNSVPNYIPAISMISLTIMGFFLLRYTLNPERVRASQSDRTLALASATLSAVRNGLNPESAQRVCELLLENTDAVAVSITDHEKILGYVGLLERDYPAGTPLKSEPTKNTLRDGEIRVIYDAEGLGYGKPADKTICAAIIAPLYVSNKIVGTLEFCYHNPRKVDENQQTMASGISQLLSTQLTAAEVDAQTQLATRMELKALQAQINPHFLFNTINTIASLIRTDPNHARELLREFAVFYRRTLENSEDLIELEKELEQTVRYFTFELARFGEDRVNLVTSIESGLETLPVPSFIIQPLVENAVNHAMRDEGQLHISVTITREDTGVVVAVADDGVGIPEDVLPRTLEPGYGTGIGIALKNVDDRLKGFFGPTSGITMESTVGVGTTVYLNLNDA